MTKIYRIHYFCTRFKSCESTWSTPRKCVHMVQAKEARVNMRGQEEGARAENPGVFTLPAFI